jgi:exonuclease SbcC
MFDFLFKRKPKTPPVPVVPVVPAKVAPTAARDAAIAAAKALQHDEAASVAFLVACDFADARLLAAQGVQSVPALQQVLAATRNTDRRVAKLMQARLDQFDTQRKLLVLATACIADAERLAVETALMPNQVSELDRRWQALTLVPDTEQQAFAALRATLGARLAAQAALQRTVIDTLAQLRALPGEQPPEVVRATLDTLVASLAVYRLSADVAAVPKHLLLQCDEAAQALRTSLVAFEQRHAASQARLALLEEWEAAAPESLQESTLQRGWQGEVTPEWQQRFDDLLQRVITARPVVVAAVVSVLPVSDQKPVFVAALQAMEQALDDGSLQVAAEADKRVRSLDLAALRPSDAQTAQLSRLRAELGRLQGWARWGGNVSREELQKAAEALPEQALAIAELAKKIGSLRERWKSLDVSAGPAPKELWHGFDAACTAAYAPVAEHFGKLAEERQANVVVATEMIAEMQRNADALVGVAHPDWKAVALFCQRSLQSWQRLGPTERKEKKRLDGEFNAVLQRLRAPLDAVRASEISEREQMIAEVAGLSANDRSALDTLRALQDRWQERAKALPLERNDEQGLWTRFRAACDAIFARRKEAATEADAGRQDNLHAKEALCVTLEQAGALAIPQVLNLLRDTATAWQGAGAVPRAAESAVDARYRQAVTALQQQVDHAQRAGDALAKQAILVKLQLCQQVESTLVEGGDTTALQDQWQALPALSAPFERALGQRFGQAQIALQQADTAYAAALEANRAVLGRELLRMEIVLSLDSPAELLRERLQLQVEVLQAALKSGQPVATEQQLLVALCNLPALVDGTAKERLQRVVERVL